MTFTYNYLNLPRTAVKTGTDVTFLYNAEGTKLRKVSKINSGGGLVTTTRNYIKGIEYNNGVIDIIHNAAGYAQKNGTDYVYHYHLTDHLGNTRATLKRGSSATAVDVVQRDNYSFVFDLKVFMSSLRSVTTHLVSARLRWVEIISIFITARRSRASLETAMITGLGSMILRSEGGMWLTRWRSSIVWYRHTPMV